MLLFLIFYTSKNTKKCIIVPTNILRSTFVFNSDKNKMLLEHQISILEWFFKDHVTLKTGIMNESWKFIFYITWINYILKCIKLEKKQCKLQKKYPEYET